MFILSKRFVAFQVGSLEGASRTKTCVIHINHQLLMVTTKGMESFSNRCLPGHIQTVATYLLIVKGTGEIDDEQRVNKYGMCLCFERSTDTWLQSPE